MYEYACILCVYRSYAYMQKRSRSDVNEMRNDLFKIPSACDVKKICARHIFLFFHKRSRGQPWGDGIASCRVIDRG